MCNISGIFKTKAGKITDSLALVIANKLGEAGIERGSDATGVFKGLVGGAVSISKHKGSFIDINDVVDCKCVLINNRAMPTTEWYEDNNDCQPFGFNNMYIVHNGTIANDKEIIKKYNLHTESKIDSSVLPYMIKKHYLDFEKEVVGSYAIAAFDMEHSTLYLIKNYKPLEIYYNYDLGLYVFSSFINLDMKDFLESCNFRKIYFPHYSKMSVNFRNNICLQEFEKNNISNKAVVICSGGLDSTTVAKIACDTHGSENVTLLHFRYGCKAQVAEITAMNRIAKALKCRLSFIDLPIIREFDSECTLFNDKEIAKGEAGAEYAHEWVAARNTAFIGLTASYCDATKTGYIYLGLNLEEGGAFEDNTVEFYEAFNKVLNIGTKSRPVIINPLANMVKHEIVKKAREIDAPIDLSWSCYRSKRNKFGELTHCGDCGPCFMRKTAHKINNIEDGISYLK